MLSKEICCAAIAEIFVQFGYDKPSAFARKHRCSRDKDAPLSMCCTLCGSEFQPQKSASKYCSQSCKQEAIRRNNRANKAKRKASKFNV